jgi:hypothetical protein
VRDTGVGGTGGLSGEPGGACRGLPGLGVWGSIAWSRSAPPLLLVCPAF